MRLFISPLLAQREASAAILVRGSPAMCPPLRIVTPAGYLIGGAYDTVPEVCILLALFNSPDAGCYVPIIFDEAGRCLLLSRIQFISSNFTGHRVATQYLLAALDGSIPAEHLLHYREANSKLPGHPELGLTPGVKFSSGRLGHMW